MKELGDDKQEAIMAGLQGSRTEQNLRDAFAGESQVRNKYTHLASTAKKEAYEQIAAIFLGDGRPGEGARIEV